MSSPAVEHVILLRFKEDVDEATKAEVVKQVRSLDTRPSVARIRMGETFTTDRAGEYTHALTVALPSREALAEYSNDEEHLRVKRDYLAPNVEKLVCLDIEDGKAGDKSDVPTWIRCPFTRTVAFSTVALAGFVLGRYRR